MTKKVEQVRNHLMSTDGLTLCRKEPLPEQDEDDFPMCGACLVAAHLMYRDAILMAATSKDRSPEDWREALEELRERKFFADSAADVADYRKELEEAKYEYPEVYLRVSHGFGVTDLDV